MPIALIAWPGLLFWAALWEGWGGLGLSSGDGWGRRR
jgi:hypothetical protein